MEEHLFLLQSNVIKLKGFVDSTLAGSNTAILLTAVIALVYILIKFGFPGPFPVHMFFFITSFLLVSHIAKVLFLFLNKMPIFFEIREKC